MRDFKTSIAIASIILSTPIPVYAEAVKKDVEKEKTLTEYYISSLRKNMNNLKGLISDLGPQKSSLNSLMGQEDSKDALLKNINRVVKLKNDEIFEYMKLTKKLERQVHQLSIKEKLYFEMKKRNLASKIDDRKDLIKGMETALKNKDERIIELKRKLGSQRHELTIKIKGLEKSLAQVREAKSYAPSSGLMAQEVKNLESKHTELNRKYTQLVNSNERSSKFFNKKMKGQGELFEEIIQSNHNLHSELRAAQVKIGELENIIHEKTEKLLASEERNKRLEEYSNDLNRRYQDLQFQYQNVTNEVEALRNNSLAKTDSNAVQVKRIPASVEAQSNYTISPVLAEKIGNFNIGDNLEFAGEKAVLTLVNDLVFTNDSFKIDKSRSDELKVLLSTFTKGLFENKDLKSKIKFINFVGHSSPRYKGEAINPMDATLEAFDHNMDLSYKRAKALADYILSADFGDFPYKKELKEKIQVSGRGFSEPILDDRSPASENDGCGNFDCDKSRRVEIFLELK